MDAFFAYLSSHLAISLFLIIGLGLVLGNFKIRGFYFGTSAIMFVALLFGHLGVTLPSEIGDLGMVLFVYAIGLQVGPRFFRTIVSKGFTFFWIALVSLGTSASAVLAFVHWMNLPATLGIGLFTGALISTPGLAAALNVTNDPTISVGYGIAYPFGILSVVIIVQLLASSKRTKDEIQLEKTDPSVFESKVITKQFLITNPNCTGKTLVEIDLHSMSKANVTRILRNNKIFMAHDDAVLQLNDIIMAVGTFKELKKLEHLLGKETHADMESVKNIVGRDAYVSSPKVVGKTLAELEIKELFGVVLTRVRRDSIEIVPCGTTSLEIGDMVHVVGDQEDCERFVNIIGQHERRIHETNLFPLAVGIVLGTMLGIYPFQLPGGITFTLGLSGGPLLVALIVGHYGRVGTISTRIPYAAKYIIREIGLAFFLAVTGTKAGANFWVVFREGGYQLTLYGIVTSLIAIFTAYLTARFLFRLNNLASIGVVCGAMTSTPALSVVSEKLDSDTPTVTFASIYAIALVAITVFSQLLAIYLS
ncbi:MAG: TrkA C-terminal domain-containing protein [bacterium]|jgi:putative transport protein|nr:TrkA C-terminal domain-containing protein [bacterium]